MIKPEQVPYNVTREALTAWIGSEGTIMQAMERAIAAALNAWPGMEVVDKVVGDDVALLLPLPTEPRDDQ